MRILLKKRSFYAIRRCIDRGEMAGSNRETGKQDPYTSITMKKHCRSSGVVVILIPDKSCKEALAALKVLS